MPAWRYSPKLGPTFFTVRTLRYIGNKTKLLDFIGNALDERGIHGGTAVDPFCGTASVAAYLKGRGFRVIAADIMQYAYVFARAYVEVSHPPCFERLRANGLIPRDDFDDVISLLRAQPPVPGVIHHLYSPGGPHGRCYFTEENAATIDSIRTTLDAWHHDGLIDTDTFHILLAALLEAADRVANTTGVYAAFVKSWQPNALRPLTLRPMPAVAGEGSRAVRVDASELIAQLEPFDLLYLDPPYNNRQYAGYYHIPELIARGWNGGMPKTRGKTGLIDDKHQRSDWSSSKRCESAFERLVALAPWKHLVMSYNAEGLIPEATIERVLRANGLAGTYERRQLTYKRYRSDADGENRRYRGDTVREYLYCVSR